MEKETNNDAGNTKPEVPQDLTIENILNSILAKLKKFDLRDLNLEDGSAPGKRHLVVSTVELVLDTAEELGYSLTVKNGRVYIFNGQYWKGISPEMIESFLGKAAEEMSVDLFFARYHVFRTDLYKQFISSSFLSVPEKPTEEVLINLKNGTFLITPEAQQLRGFKQEDFLTYQLPFSFDPAATSPIFKQFLDKVLPDMEQQNVLAEFVGYVFIRHRTLKLEKFLILLGDGSNGKSVFFDVISALLGNENVSNFSLQSLTNDTGYFRAMLTDKLVNYSPEISTQMNTTIFKQLVSGEKVEARFPYGKPFILEDYAKLMFNTNELPREIENNHAFFRRFLIIHFGVTIKDGDPELAKKIIASELPGVFNWVLDGLKRLLSQKKFTHSREMDSILEEYKRDSDTVLTFLIDEGYEKNVDAEMKLAYFYQFYVSYCRRSGFKAGSKRLFSKRLKGQKFRVWKKNSGMYVDVGKISFPAASLSSLPSPKNPLSVSSE